MGLPTIQPYDLPSAAELPASRGPWQVETGRAALLIHDMQNYFVRPFVADASPLAPATANIARLAAHCRQKGIPVFYTAQNGDQDRRDRGLQADIWGPRRIRRSSRRLRLKRAISCWSSTATAPSSAPIWRR
jgi:bifunctional isochorismate lyase/aryl carrier protein